MRYAITLRGKTHYVVLEEHADGPRFVVEGTLLEPRVKPDGDGGYDVRIDGRRFHFRIHHGRIEDTHGPMDVQIRRARPELVRAGGKGRRTDGKIKPPMPGKIVEVHVQAGSVVVEGTPLVVLEAMKMQNEIRSPLAGTVAKVHVAAGQNVEVATVLVEVEPAAEPAVGPAAGTVPPGA